MLRCLLFSVILFAALCARAAQIEPLHTHRVVKHAVTGLAFSPDNKNIAVAYADNSLRLYAVSKEIEMAKFDVSGGPNCLKFSPDGKYLLAITNGGVLSVDVQTRKIKHVFRSEAAGGIAWLDISPDGKMLAAVGRSSLSVWNLETGVNVATVDAHSGNAVNCVAFSPEGDVIATAGNDKKLITWNATTIQPQREFQLTSKGLGIAYAPGGSHLVVVCDDRAVRRVDTASGEEEQLAATGAAVKSVAVAPDRAVGVLSGFGAQPGVLLIDKKRLITTKIVGHATSVAAVAMSPDGRFFASGDQGGVVNIYATLDVER